MALLPPTLPIERMVDFAGVEYSESELPEAVGMTYDQVMQARDQKAALCALYLKRAEFCDMVDLICTD